MHTTLNKVRSNNPCKCGWERLLSYQGKTKADDEPLSLATVLASNGVEDAIWCLRTIEGHDREIRLFAVACAREVQHLMTDPQSLAALDTAERYAKGEATAEELASVAHAARFAALDAWEATDTAKTVRAAAQAASQVTWAPKTNPDSIRDAQAASRVAWAARTAMQYTAARERQAEIFLSFFGD